MLENDLWNQINGAPPTKINDEVILEFVTPGKWRIGYDNDESMRYLIVGPARIAFSYNINKEKRKQVAADALMIHYAAQTLKKVNALKEHLHNLIGMIDTPVGRRKFQQPLFWEAIADAKKDIGL